MANSVIDSEMVILLDNWPSLDTLNAPGPDNATAPATGPDQNVETAAHPIGTKWTSFQEGATGIPRGKFTLIYLKLGTQNPDTLLTCAAGTTKCLCCNEDVSENGSATQAYTVTNDGDETGSEKAGLAAVALSAMTNDYYGWFWCGGVAPISIVPGLAGDFYTANDVAIGEISLIGTDVGNGEIGFDLISAGYRAAGIALKADD